WNSTPLRRLKRQVFASAEGSQDSASEGPGVRSGRTSTRVSRTWADTFWITLSHIEPGSKVSVVLPPPMAWRKTPPRFGCPSWAAADLAGTAASRPAAPVPARNCRRLKSGLFRNLVILSHPLLDHLVARCLDRPRDGRCVPVPASV